MTAYIRPESPPNESSSINDLDEIMNSISDIAAKSNNQGFYLCESAKIREIYDFNSRGSAK